MLFSKYSVNVGIRRPSFHLVVMRLTLTLHNALVLFHIGDAEMFANFDSCTAAISL